jgi:hypothetical protein
VLTLGQKIFLQRITSQPSLTQSSILKLYKSVQASYAMGVPVAAADDNDNDNDNNDNNNADDLKIAEMGKCLGAINKNLIESGLEIKKMTLNDVVFYILVNNSCDSLAKQFGARYNQQEISLFKSGLSLLLASSKVKKGGDNDDDDDEGEGGENDTSVDYQIIPPSHTSSISRNSFLSTRKALSATAAEKVLDMWITEKWFTVSGSKGSSKIMLGARGIAEITEVIRGCGVEDLPQVVTLR